MSSLLQFVLVRNTLLIIFLTDFVNSSYPQLQLLLQYLKDDPRKAVKRLAINDLKLLAKKAPHLWIRENTQVLLCSSFCLHQFKICWQ